MWLVSALFVVGCAQPAAQPAPQLDGQPLRFLPILGAGPVQVATPGEWRSTLRYRRFKYVTMEHTESRTVRGEAQLSILTNGRFDACFVAHTATASSISKYATNDGTQHDHSASDQRTQRFTGRWTQEHGWLVLHAEGTADSCSGPTTSTEPLALRAVVVSAGTILPTRVLALQVPSGVGRELRFPVGIAAGVDASDPRLLGSPGSVPSAEGWVLLGETPGLALNWVDERAGPVMTAAILAAVP